jgi:hypothetical protein
VKEIVNVPFQESVWLDVPVGLSWSKIQKMILNQGSSFPLLSSDF